ncbi:hypothetical protein G6F56_007789 [Rhizopus delemar]|nr:hypothetical protein G6F56_007789 [Rhizopus delemar]
MEALLIRLTNKSIKEIEEGDFTIESMVQNPPKYMSDDDDSSIDDDDDIDDIEDEQVKPKSMEEAIANLSSEDYDSIKYTGISAGIQLQNNDLFKTASYVQCPGRQDVALKMMPQKELLVVQANASSLSGKYTRLDVGFSLTSSIFDTKRDASTQRSLHLTPGSLSKSDSLPLASSIKKASDLYFTHIHKFLPIVNKTRFEAHDLKPCNILAQAVLAVAFRFASRHFPKQFKKSDVYADIYFRKVMSRLQDSHRARLCHVQAALLMTLYLDMDETDVESMQWFVLGKAIRMAQDIGLHRSCSHWNLPASEIETRHRVFFACYILDRFMGARAGKPLTILDRDFDTDFPVPHEVYDDQRPGPSVYHGFIALIKLSEILGRILKALYAPNSKHSNSNANLDDPTILAVFDRRLKNWKATSLNETQDGIKVSQAERESNVHHDALATESRQACENAACNVMAIVKQKQSFMTDPDSYAPFCLPTSFVYSMFQSCLIHLALVLQNRDSLLRLKRLQCSIILLKKHEEQLASAQRAHRILITLMNVHNIQLNSLISTEEEDQFNLLEDSEITDISTTEKNTISNDMPKSTYYQRMMNTSIVGGITPDLHQRIESNMIGQLLPEPSQPALFSDNRLYEKPPTSDLQVMNDSYPTVYSHHHHPPPPPPPLYQTPQFSSYDLNYTPTSCESHISFAPTVSPAHLNWSGWNDPINDFQNQRTYLHQHPS